MKSYYRNLFRVSYSARSAEKMQRTIDVSIEKAAVELKNQGPVQRAVLTHDEMLWLYNNTRGDVKNKIVAVRFCAKFRKEIAPSTISKYKCMKVAPVGAKRGRDPLLTEEEEAKLLQAFIRIRSISVAVRARTTACVARGIAERSRKGISSVAGCKFSTAWATDWMKRNGIRRAAATTDRTQSAAAITAAGISFYEKLQRHADVPRRNVYNVDEFVVKYEPARNYDNVFTKCTSNTHASSFPPYGSAVSSRGRM